MSSSGIKLTVLDKDRRAKSIQLSNMGVQVMQGPLSAMLRSKGSVAAVDLGPSVTAKLNAVQTSLDSKLATFEQAVASKLDAVQSSVKALESKSDTAAITAKLSDLEKGVTAKIDTVGAAVKTLESKSDTTAIASKLSNLEKATTEIKSKNTNTKFDKVGTDIGALNSKVQDVKQSVQQLKQATETKLQEVLQSVPVVPPRTGSGPPSLNVALAELGAAAATAQAQLRPGAQSGSSAPAPTVSFADSVKQSSILNTQQVFINSTDNFLSVNAEDMTYSLEYTDPASTSAVRNFYSQPSLVGQNPFIAFTLPNQPYSELIVTLTPTSMITGAPHSSGSVSLVFITDYTSSAKGYYIMTTEPNLEEFIPQTDSMVEMTTYGITKNYPSYSNTDMFLMFYKSEEQAYYVVQNQKVIVSFTNAASNGMPMGVYGEVNIVSGEPTDVQPVQVAINISMGDLNPAVISGLIPRGQSGGRRRVKTMKRRRRGRKSMKRQRSA